MKRTLGCMFSVFLFAVLTPNLSVRAWANPAPQSTPCPSVQIASKALVVSNTCSQTLDVRVATPKGVADNTVAAGQTWETGLAVDSTNSYKYWSCPELLYPIDTTTNSEATYASTKVRCLSKP
jgi:hypothetical protein